MKKVELKQILENALDNKNGSYKIISARDEKITKLVFSSLTNIEKHYNNKYENLSSDIIKHHYNVADIFTPSKKYMQKSKELNKDTFDKKMSIILQHKIITSAQKYITLKKGKVISYLSFDKMPEEKVEKLEKINAFFEKNNISEEETAKNNIKEL